MRIFSICLIIFFSITTYSWETDQFSLPATELADIGPALSDFLIFKIKKAVKAYNEEVLRGGAYNRENSHQHMAQLVFNNIAPAIAKQEHRDAIWGGKLTFIDNPNGKIRGNNVLFSPGKTNNIYTYAAFHRVLSSSYFVHSSTIKAYEVEFGLDKLGHTFNEGHKYFSIYLAAIGKGDSESNAIKAAVKYGVETEKTYFGKIVSGIYSNADLAANFTGLLFYKNLFAEVFFNGKKYPAILNLNAAGKYIIHQSLINSQHLYQRLVSYHLNEAFNPSHYEYMQRYFIKRGIKKRCHAWRSRYPFYFRDYYDAIREQMKTFNGYVYGQRTRKLFSISEVCFPQDKD